MKTYDTHAHIDHLEDIPGALKRAKEAGVEGIVAMSMDLASCKKNLEIAGMHSDPKIYLCMGMHPSETNIDDLDACLGLIRRNKEHLTAIGEIGLDFWYKWVRKDQEKKDAQRKAYRAFLELAKELDLPAVIHSRGCWRECLETAKIIGIKKAEFHWYSGPIDVLEDIVKEGYYVSTTPSVAYSPQSQEAMVHAPIEHVLIETDCPVFFQNRDSADKGFKAEPKDVFKTLEAYCSLKKIDKEQALTIFNNNARKFFNIH